MEYYKYPLEVLLLFCLYYKGGGVGLCGGICICMQVPMEVRNRHKILWNSYDSQY